LKGRYYWSKRTKPGLYKGIEHFKKAIDQDPNYAAAYAGLADSYIILANWGIAPPGDEYERARAAALKAVELDDELAEAHTALAYTTLLYDWIGTVPKRNFAEQSHSTQTMLGSSLLQHSSHVFRQAS